MSPWQLGRRISGAPQPSPSDGPEAIGTARADQPPGRRSLRGLEPTYGPEQRQRQQDQERPPKVWVPTVATPRPNGVQLGDWVEVDPAAAADWDARLWDSIGWQY